MRRVAIVLAWACLALLLAGLAAIWILSRLAFGWLNDPPGPCSQANIQGMLSSSALLFPQLGAAHVERSICPASLPGSARNQLLVIAPGIAAEGIPFQPYDDTLEWGPEAALELVPDLFPGGDLSGPMIASSYDQGRNHVLHLLRRADGTGPLVLVWMWL